MLFEFSRRQPRNNRGCEKDSELDRYPPRNDGKLRIEPSDFRPEKHDHLVCDRRNALSFSRSAAFGRVRFHHGKSAPDWCRAGGPDIHSAAFDRAFFDGFLKRHARAPIKSVSLLQSDSPHLALDGDEILWRAKIAPLRTAGSLSSTRRDRLFRETRFVAIESLRHYQSGIRRSAAGIGLIHQKWKRDGVVR